MVKRFKLMYLKKVMIRERKKFLIFIEMVGKIRKYDSEWCVVGNFFYIYFFINVCDIMKFDTYFSPEVVRERRHNIFDKDKYSVLVCTIIFT